ncbi:MAG: IPExxxVDY family protein [Flavobacteriales bacterium]
MVKQLLKIEPDLSFTLLGVGCHLKDYRFAWTLNNILKTQYYKTDPLVIDKTNSTFSKYHFQSDIDHTYILANKSHQGYLVPKKKNVDYWLVLQLGFDLETRNQLIKLIRQSDSILTVFEENDKKIKEQFLF